VPAYLAIPKIGTGPYPCVILLHGLNGSKEFGWRGNDGLAIKLLASGFSVLSMDAAYHGDRSASNDYESPGVFVFKKRWMHRGQDMAVQTIIDYRRAMDYLASRDEIDASRIGLIGYSMGGFNTFGITAVDDRVKASVACVTPTIKAPFSPSAAYHYAPYITSQPFLMLMGKTDRYYTIEQAQQLHNFIKSDTKELIFYDSGHGLPSEWTIKAIEWMELYLK